MPRSPMTAPSYPPRNRRAWTAPCVEDLPHLNKLTLQTGAEIPGDCGTGGSGSTCF